MAVGGCPAAPPFRALSRSLPPGAGGSGAVGGCSGGRGGAATQAGRGECGWRDDASRPTTRPLASPAPSPVPGSPLSPHPLAVAAACAARGPPARGGGPSVRGGRGGVGRAAQGGSGAEGRRERGGHGGGGVGGAGPGVGPSGGGRAGRAVEHRAGFRPLLRPAALTRQASPGRPGRSSAWQVAAVLCGAGPTGQAWGP